MKQEKRAMQTLKKLILFFGCNIIGFTLPGMLYLFSISTGIIDLNAENFDTNGFFWGTTQTTDTGVTPIPFMIALPSLTWAICALFSFSYFFVSKKWGRFFLLAPLVLPFLHSLVILLKFI